MPTPRREKVAALTVTSRSRETRAARLKERIYVTFAALAVTVSLLSHGQVTALDAISTLGVTVPGTLAAVFTADVISHLIVHEKMLTRAEFGHAATVSASALGAIVLPMLFLLAAQLGTWSPVNALRASTGVAPGPDRVRMDRCPSDQAPLVATTPCSGRRSRPRPDRRRPASSRTRRISGTRSSPDQAGRP